MCVCVYVNRRDSGGLFLEIYLPFFLFLSPVDLFSGHSLGAGEFTSFVESGSFPTPRTTFFVVLSLSLSFFCGVSLV